MRIFKNKHFARWATEVGLTDKILIRAVQEIDDGLFDANLGGSVYKKRVSVTGQGKRGAFRTLLAYKRDNLAFYVYGFAKNQRANIGTKELKALKRLAKEYLRYSKKDLNKAIKTRVLIEVCKND